MTKTMKESTIKETSNTVVSSSGLGVGKIVTNHPLTTTALIGGGVAAAYLYQQSQKPAEERGKVANGILRSMHQAGEYIGWEFNALGEAIDHDLGVDEEEPTPAWLSAILEKGGNALRSFQETVNDMWDPKEPGSIHGSQGNQR